MAGTIFSLAMSTQVNSQGKPLIDAPLAIFAANTNEPALAYQDFGLSVAHTWPLRTDSNGRLPPFWLPDGQYRARLTDAAGAVIYFDVPSIQAVGPSEGGEGGGGSGVDPNAIFQTGDPIWVPKSGARAGWVRMNGRTIGSVSSGASERANADTQSLYEFLWNNYSDDLCPVTGGRGDTASADFAANKPIAILDMRGYGPMGLDDMGNSAAGRIVDGTPTAAGSSGGSEKRTLTQGNLPNVSLSGTTNTTGNHSHSYTRYYQTITGAQGGWDVQHIWSSTTGANTGDAGNHSHTVTVSLGGSGTPLNIMSPYRLGTWYQRL